MVHLLAVGALVGGCWGPRGLLQPLPPVPQGSAATVTITVKKGPLPGAGASMIITIDDRDVVALRPGDQYTLPVEAGWRTIGVKWGGFGGQARTPAWNRLDERLQAGQHYDFWVEPARPGSGIRKLSVGELPALELSLSLRTLAEVEARLLGDSGLMRMSRGTRPIEAEFKGLTPTGREILRLSTLIRDALASPAGSEVELQGTVDGAKFKATMDKDRQGRTRVRFEGLRFNDEQEMREFVAPLDAATLQEFRLDGSVAGRRIRDFWVEPARGALELSLSYRTLAEVEARLLGGSGLVRGTRPFEAEFEGLTLIGQEVRRLSTLIREALASPAGSEVELKGTIDGVNFEATMDKDREGRARVRFEGLRFKDEQEMREFVAPLETETLKEFRLDGAVAGRRIQVKR